MSAGEYFMQLYRELSLAEGYDWPVITAQQWAEAGTAWNVFPNTILLPNQGSMFGYRARPYGLDPDRCLFEIFSLDQVPVADYESSGTSSPSSTRTTVTPALAWCSTRTWLTPRRSRWACTPPASTGTG